MIADWLSRHNHERNRDEEIPGMCIIINTIESCMDIPYCITAGQIKEVTLEDEHLSAVSECILHSWQSIKMEIQKEWQPYSSFKDEIAIIDGIAIK